VPFSLCTQATYPDQFRLDYALSREQNNRKGGKMYIQDKMEEYADEIFGLLDQVGGREAG
jgi:ferredoxin--NADP+ reductase